MLKSSAGIFAYQVVGANGLRRRGDLPGVGRQRRRPGRGGMVGDVGWVGCPAAAGLAGRPT